MRALGYRPHASARALKSNRSRILGLIVPYHRCTDAPGQYRYIVSLAAACRRHGYELLVISGEEGVEGMRRLTESALCDGILIMDVLDRDPRVEAARESRIPSVFIGFSHDADGVVATDTDFEAIGSGCAQRLHDAGHRRALVINPTSEHIMPMAFCTASPKRSTIAHPRWGWRWSPWRSPATSARCAQRWTTTSPAPAPRTPSSPPPPPR